MSNPIPFYDVVLIGYGPVSEIMALSLALTIATAVFNGIRIPIRDDHPPAP